MLGMVMNEDGDSWSRWEEIVEPGEIRPLNG